MPAPSDCGGGPLLAGGDGDCGGGFADVGLGAGFCEVPPGFAVLVAPAAAVLPV